MLAHGKPALRTPLAPDAAASTATRPNVRDDGQRPSSRDGMAGVVGVIWVSREAEYFCGRGWTGQISLKLLEKIVHSRSGRDPWPIHVTISGLTQLNAVSPQSTLPLRDDGLPRCVRNDGDRSALCGFDTIFSRSSSSPHERSDMRDETQNSGCRFAHPGYDAEHDRSDAAASIDRRLCTKVYK